MDDADAEPDADALDVTLADAEVAPVTEVEPVVLEEEEALLVAVRRADLDTVSVLRGETLNVRIDELVAEPEIGAEPVEVGVLAGDGDWWAEEVGDCD